MQIDPNTQAPSPVGSTLSEDLHAPAPSVEGGGRRSKKGGRKARKGAPAQPRVDGLADVIDAEVTEQMAGASSAVIESTDLDAVIGRLRSGVYNTREVAEAIARRLLASGDL